MVLILGSNGVAGVSAAGVLLTATGTVGALAYGGWALADRFWTKRRTRLRPHALATAPAVKLASGANRGSSPRSVLAETPTTAYAAAVNVMPALGARLHSMSEPGSATPRPTGTASPPSPRAGTRG